MATLTFISPVGAEMARVEARLRDIGEDDFPWLRELLDHIINGRGKRIRPAITLLTGHLYHYEEERHIPMAMAVELLHVASLIHDDTVDEADLRRGRKTVNAQWGVNVAVLLGDYLYANSAELICSTGNIRVIQLLAQTARLLSSGELRELHTAYNWQQGRDYYWGSIVRKTASLFSTAAQTGAILGGAPEADIRALEEYGTNLGMAFQVVDDILDFQGQEEEVGKPVGHDLLQGVLTLPAILFLERYSDEFLSPARTPWGDPEVAARLVDKVRHSPAIGEAYQMAEGFCQRARAALADLRDGVYRRALLEIIDYTLARGQ